MGKQPLFSWDEESGICSCVIYLDDFLQGFGIAECADQDRDMISENTGRYIAETRAQINLMQNYKNRELYPGLKAYKHLLATMINSPRYNPKSYEAKRLNKEISNIEKTIKEIEDTIQATKKILYEYINSKEKMYQRIRKNELKEYSDKDAEELIKDIGVYEKLNK